MSRKEKLEQFLAVTGASEWSARCLLEANSWNVERAISQFFDDGEKTATTSLADRGDAYPEDPTGLTYDELQLWHHLLVRRIRKLERGSPDDEPVSSDASTPLSTNTSVGHGACSRDDRPSACGVSDDDVRFASFRDLTLVREEPRILATIRIPRRFEGPGLPLSSLQDIEYALGELITEEQAERLRQTLLPHATGEGVNTLEKRDYFLFWRSAERKRLLCTPRPVSLDDSKEPSDGMSFISSLIESVQAIAAMAENMPDSMENEEELVEGSSMNHQTESCHIKLRAKTSELYDSSKPLRCRVHLCAGVDEERAEKARLMVDHPLATEDAIVLTIAFAVKQTTSAFKLGELCGALKDVLRHSMDKTHACGYKIFCDRGCDVPSSSEEDHCRSTMRVSLIFRKEEDKKMNQWESFLWSFVRTLRHMDIEAELKSHDSHSDGEIGIDGTPLASSTSIDAWEGETSIHMPKCLLPIFTANGMMCEETVKPHHQAILKGMHNVDMSIDFDCEEDLCNLLPPPLSQMVQWSLMCTMCSPEIAKYLRSAPEVVGVVYDDMVCKLEGLRGVQLTHREFSMSLRCSGAPVSSLVCRKQLYASYPPPKPIVDGKSKEPRAPRRLGNDGRERFFFCCLGTGKVGTSSLVAAIVDPTEAPLRPIKSHVHSQYEPPTQRASFTMGGEMVDVMVVDSRSHRPPSVVGVDVVLLCFDLSDRKSFKIVNYVSTSISKAVPLMLVGLRSDLPRKVDRSEAIALSEDVGAATYVECSSLKGQGVANVVLQGIRVCREHAREE